MKVFKSSLKYLLVLVLAVAGILCAIYAAFPNSVLSPHTPYGQGFVIAPDTVMLYCVLPLLVSFVLFGLAYWLTIYKFNFIKFGLILFSVSLALMIAYTIFLDVISSNWILGLILNLITILVLTALMAMIIIKLIKENKKVVVY